MNENSKPFFSAFPNLIMDEKYRELLRFVTVERVTVNSVRNRLRVYISSDNWLKKSTVFEMEKAIREQVFPETEMEVKIIERFHLSVSYTPANFYKVYRSSMLRELKEVSPLLQHTLLHAALEFPEDGSVHVRFPDSVISKERKQYLAEYLEKIFRERAGFASAEPSVSSVSSCAEAATEVFR